MKSFLNLLATASIISAGALLATAPATAQQPPIKIGVPTSIQLQVGRDTQNAIKMALEDINGKGGLLGRKLEMVAADETENPEQGIAAIKKLTADDKVDVLIGGSQKAVMIPPGLSYIAISPRAWDRMESTYNPRYYFDLRKERKNAQKGESAYTPPVALIAALGASLDYIAGQAEGNLAEGRKKLVNNAETCAAMTRAAAKALGFKLFAPEGYEAAAATAIMAPEGTDSGTLVKGLKSQFAAIVTDGQGDMKGSLFRIAHIGFFDYLDTIAIIGAPSAILPTEKASKPACGSQSKAASTCSKATDLPTAGAPVIFARPAALSREVLRLALLKKRRRVASGETPTGAGQTDPSPLVPWRISTDMLTADLLTRPS